MYDYTMTFSSIGFIRDGEGAILVEGVDLRPRPGDVHLLPAPGRPLSASTKTPIKKITVPFSRPTAFRHAT